MQKLLIGGQSDDTLSSWSDHSITIEPGGVNSKIGAHRSILLVFISSQV